MLTSVYICHRIIIGIHYVLVFVRLTMVSLSIINKNIKNNISSLTIPELCISCQFSNIERHSSISAAHDLNTLASILLKLPYCKIGFCMTGLII